MLTRVFDLGVVKRKLLFKKGAVMTVTSSANVETELDMAELAALNDIAAADLAKIDGITNGTAAANKALVLGASKEIATITSATITTLTSTTVNSAALTGTTTLTMTSANAAALAVGLAGATNPSFVVDSSTASQAAGLKVTGAVAAGTVAVAVISSGADANLTINAKGTGTIGIGSVSTGAVTVTPALTASATIQVSGATVNANLGMVTVGTAVTATGTDISANTDRVAGVSVNLLNTAATITGLRGVDARAVDNGGTGAANIVGVQGVSTKTAGSGSGEQWGGNFIAHVNGGKVENVYGVVGSVDVATAASVGTAGAPIGYVAGVLASIAIESAATLGGSATPDLATVVAPSIAVLLSGATNKRKADGAYVAILGGDGAGSVTAGAAFKVMRHNSTAANKFDFGLDMFYNDLASFSNTFAIADISLSGSISTGERLVIASGSAANDAAIVTQVGADSTIADGSLYLSTAGTGAVFMKVSDAWVAVTHA